MQKKSGVLQVTKKCLTGVLEMSEKDNFIHQGVLQVYQEKTWCLKGV